MPDRRSAAATPSKPDDKIERALHGRINELEAEAEYDEERRQRLRRENIALICLLEDLREQLTKTPPNVGEALRMIAEGLR
jgi:hypothetical protein